MGQRIENNNQDKPTVFSALLCLVLGVVFAAVGWLMFCRIGYKYVTIAAGVGIILLLCFGDLKRLGKLPALLLIAHSAFTMFTIFWSLSGKFFLARYSTTFVATFFLLYAILRGRGSHVFARRAMSVTAIAATVYAVLGVEAASTGHFKELAAKIAGEAVPSMHGGARLSGAFGNSNIEASFYAIGIIFCLGLICAAESRLLRALWTGALVCNAYAMLLGISLGAIACFGVAVVVYLIAADRQRGAVLPRMLLGALCAAAGVLFNIAKFGSNTGRQLLFIMLAAAAAAAVVELVSGTLVVGFFTKHEKVSVGVCVAVLALAAAYVVAGISITGPESFTDKRKSIERSVVLSAGSQLASFDGDGDIAVVITSQTPEQVMTGYRDEVYRGTVGELNGSYVDIPVGSTACFVTMSGTPGMEIRQATLGGKRIALHYTLFPEFIGRRVTALSGSTSLQQRLTYVRDSMRLFRLSPLAGLGDGAFETAISSVQSYEYEAVHSHNQYVESLIEGGIIGFTLFTCGVVTVGVALWRARGKMREGAYAPLYGALCAEFVMSALQMLWDVTMFVMVFICMIYTLYGIVSAACAEPLVIKREEREDGDERPEPYVRRRERSAKEADAFTRVVCCILPMLFIVSVALNLRSQKLMNKSASNLGEFLSNLSEAARWDLYEHNDAKLSYVRAVMEYDSSGIFRVEADEYAAQLAKVRSNSIPYVLVVYYLNTQRYSEAIEEAKTAAGFSASNSDTWNNCVSALGQVFIDSGRSSPLLKQGGDSLLWKLQEYQGLLEIRNAEKLKPIKLNSYSKSFFNTLDKLIGCNGDKTLMAAVLNGEG